MRGKKVIVVTLCALLLFGALAFASVSLGQQKALADEATFISTTADGFLQGEDADYNAAHVVASLVVDGQKEPVIGQLYAATPVYAIFRSAVFFDTSSLPDNAVITSATLSLFGSSDGSDTDFDITVVNGSLLNDPLVLGDYGYLLNQTTSGGVFNTTGFSTSGYNDIPLNSVGMGWISRTGMTKLGLRSSRDIEANDSFPNINEVVTFYPSEYDDSSSDYSPKLVVSYVYSTTSVPTLSQWGMIGMAIVLGAFLAWSVRRRLVVSSDNS